MSKTNSATLEAKMAVSRTSAVFSMEHCPGENPRVDAVIERALAATAEGKPWTRLFRVPKARRPSVG